MNGDYPQRILDTFPESILRRFTDEEKIELEAIYSALDKQKVDRYPSREISGIYPEPDMDGDNTIGEQSKMCL